MKLVQAFLILLFLVGDYLNMFEMTNIWTQIFQYKEQVKQENSGVGDRCLSVMLGEV